MKSNVSIVIPAFSSVSFLSKSIDSALNQSYACEVIVCNHGGHKDIDLIVKRYGKKIRYIKSENNKGPEYAWFDGLQSSSGEYVHFHFDDDVMYDDYIKKTLKYFNDDVGFVVSNANVIDDKEKILNQNLFKFNLDSGIHKISKFNKYALNKLVSPCAVLFRKKDIQNILIPFKPNFIKYQHHGVGVDILMTLNHSLIYKKFAYVNECLVNFRAHDLSITFSSMNNFDNFINLHKTYNEYRKLFLIYKIINNKFFNAILGLRLISLKNIFIFFYCLNVPLIKRMGQFLLKKKYEYFKNK